MEQVFSFLREFNLQNILSLGLIVWYFTRDLKSSIDNLDKDVRAMNTRIGRLEGTVYGKDIYKHIDNAE